jgi:pilus assembly protein Flp/PilA
MNTLVRFAKDDSAATAIEYCIMASLISIVILLAVNGVGTKLNATYAQVSTALK